MHPLPSQEHLDYLVGSELTQITIDPYQVRFYLSGVDVATGITVSSPFLYREGDTEDRFEPDSGCRGQGPVKFHALLMQKISALEVTPAGDRLTLQFDSGQTLSILSEIDGPYESGSITDRNGRLWIF